jgi:hypothetical protein
MKVEMVSSELKSHFTNFTKVRKLACLWTRAAFANSATVASIPNKFDVATLPNGVIGCSDGSDATVGIEDLVLRVFKVVRARGLNRTLLTILKSYRAGY